MTSRAFEHAPKLPPGRLGLPVIGETLAYLTDKDFAAKRQQQYGPIFKTHIFGHPTVVVIGPEASRFVLSTHAEWFPNGWPTSLQRLFEGTIPVQDGAEHQRVRDTLMPVFHGKALGDYIVVIERHTRRYLERWKRLGSFDWADEFRQLTFDIVCELFLGWQPGSAETAHLSKLYKTYFDGIFSIPIALPWSRFGRALRARGQLWSEIEVLLRQRIATPTNDLLGKLVQLCDPAGNGLSLDELRRQTVAFVTGGHETSTSLITSLVYAISCHPAILQRLRAEQEQLALSGPLTLDQLREMTYLEHSIWEAERLYPPANGAFRRVTKAMEFNGYRIPSGWRLHYRIPEVHLDPAIYDEPRRFDPERFGPGRAEHKRQPFGFLPYGAGERSCMGISLARMEIKIILAYMLRELDWELAPGQDFSLAHLPTCHLKHGLRVTLKQSLAATAVGSGR